MSDNWKCPSRARNAEMRSKGLGSTGMDLAYAGALHGLAAEKELKKSHHKLMKYTRGERRAPVTLPTVKFLSGKEGA